MIVSYGNNKRVELNPGDLTSFKTTIGNPRIGIFLSANQETTSALSCVITSDPRFAPVILTFLYDGGNVRINSEHVQELKRM